MRIVRVVGLFAVLTLATRAGAQESRTLAVTVRGTMADANGRVVAALAEQGVAVAEAQGAVVRTAPYRFNPATDVVLIANLVQRDSTTTVIFSGTYSVPTLGVRDQPMTETTSRLKGQLWAWLTGIAKKVAATPTS